MPVFEKILRDVNIFICKLKFFDKNADITKVKAVEMANNPIGNSDNFRIEIQGQIYDLSLLENLIGKKCTNSVFLEWESKSANGNGDGIFTKEEVAKLQKRLYDKYVNDKKITQNELDEVFGKNKNKKSNLTLDGLKNIFAALVKIQEKSAKNSSTNTNTKAPQTKTPQKAARTKPSFTPQKPSTQTPKIIDPQDAPATVKAKYNTLQKIAGNALSLKKNPDGTYTITRTDTQNSELKGYKSIEYVYDSQGNFKYQLNYSATDKSVKIGRIISDGRMVLRELKDSKGFISLIPDNIKQKNAEMKQDNGKTRIIRGYSTITIEQTDGQYLKANGISKILHKYDMFGKLIEQEYVYNNGRTVKNYSVSSKRKDPAHTPNPIKIILPEQYQGVGTKKQIIYGLDTKGPKDTAQRFAGQLENSKAKLMSILGLTNEEYDNLAILAMGIAEQETHFGQLSYVSTEGKRHSQQGLQHRAERKVIANSLVWSKEEQTHHSQGITQINYAGAIKNPLVKKRFEEYGIKSFDDLLKSVEKQAIATMIILAENKKTAESELWQKRLVKNNAKIKNPNDMLTTNDVIALLWNGAGGVVTRLNEGETITINSEKLKTLTVKNPDGTTEVLRDVKGAFYAKAVRAYASKFFATPQTANTGSMHTTEHAVTPGVLGANSQDNTGLLGEIIFMPKSYSNKNRVYSSQNTYDLAKLIVKNNNNLSDKSKNMFISYIMCGYISFGNRGLTEEEISSVTEEDFKLISNTVIDILSKKINPQEANERFEQAYLRRREFNIPVEEARKHGLMSNTRSDSPKKCKYVAGNLDFEINPGFYYSIDRHSAQYHDVNPSNYTGFAVTRSYGVNPLLADGSTAPLADRVLAEYAEYTATNLLESGGMCKTGVVVALEYSMGIDHTKIRTKDGRSIPLAKMMTEFYDSHPEVFEKVRYVDNGDGTARELNPSDVNNLPCGYLGVFKPGKGYEQQAGHDFISDGFGECNSDEHDNGEWAHFASGKGEHGTLEVYRIKSDRIATFYSEKLKRVVNVPLDIDPSYLTPEFRELQNQARIKRGEKPLEAKQNF